MRRIVQEYSRAINKHVKNHVLAFVNKLSFGVVTPLNKPCSCVSRRDRKMNYKFEITKMTYQDFVSLFRYGPQLLTTIIDRLQRVAVSDLRGEDLCSKKMDGDEKRHEQNAVKQQFNLFEKHRIQGLKWCREFLSGSWSNLDETDFIFTQLG